MSSAHLTGHQKNPLGTSTFAKAPADVSDTTVDLQPDRMPCIEAAGWAISCVPTRCPFTRVTIERRGVQAQSGNDGERVALARVDRDPIARTALAIPAKLG